MNGISDSVRVHSDVVACEDCGSTSRIGRGLCLNCLLQGALAGVDAKETLEQVLDEIDVRDADWRIGNYQILEEIGRGGMGVIYRARQRHSRRIVALKRILSYQADSQETLVRFRREAEAAASLDHPNILPIYEVSESEDGLPFFSMKFAAGGSLLDAAPALRNEPRRSVALMAKVTRAVQYAHLQGILHRDLKPGNILLDARGEPLVSDFADDFRHARIHCARASETISGEPHADGRCLQPRRDPVRSVHWPPAVLRRARAGRNPASV